MGPPLSNLTDSLDTRDRAKLVGGVRFHPRTRLFFRSTFAVWLGAAQSRVNRQLRDVGGSGGERLVYGARS